VEDMWYTEHLRTHSNNPRQLTPGGSPPWFDLIDIHRIGSGNLLDEYFFGWHWGTSDNWNMFGGNNHDRLGNDGPGKTQYGAFWLGSTSSAIPRIETDSINWDSGVFDFKPGDVSIPD